MGAAPVVVEAVGGEDEQDGQGQQTEFIDGPYLFGYQKDHSGYEEQPGGRTAVVPVKAMPEGGSADGEGQPDHTVFKKGVVDDVDAQYGQGCHEQWQDGAVDSA